MADSGAKLAALLCQAEEIDALAFLLGSSGFRAVLVGDGGLPKEAALLVVAANADPALARETAAEAKSAGIPVVALCDADADAMAMDWAGVIVRQSAHLSDIDLKALISLDIAQILDGAERLPSCQLLFDQMTDGVFLFSIDGRLVLVNESASRMLGYERQEMLGRTAGVVFSQILQPPSVKGLELRQALPRYAIPPFDTTLRAASGRTIPVSFASSFIRDAYGEVIGMIGIARNISERKALEERLSLSNELLEEEVRARTTDLRDSEERYRALIEQLPNAVVTEDKQNRIMSLNPAAKELLGLDESAIGRDFVQAIPCDGCEHDMSCRHAAKSKQVWVGECVVHCGEEDALFMLHTCKPLVDDGGGWIGGVHVFANLGQVPPVSADLLRDAGGLIITSARGARRIVTRSPAMERSLALVAACANSSITVLIEGESGTGKDLIAEALHYNSDRASGPYVDINCAALEEGFLKSELFGHVRGAFTGAVQARQGLLELADGGTLFIDEVGDMSLPVQAMLLRVIETKRFRRLGATDEKEVDVRIIAATNKDLEEEVREGRFRHDLFYRLKVVRINLPPLRERAEDIPLLVEHMLDGMCNSEPGSRRKSMTSRTLKLLSAYDWPGNVRELENVLRQAVLLSGGSPRMDEKHLPEELISPRVAGQAQTLAEVERRHVADVLHQANGSRSAAAKVLGISRSTLRRKLSGK